MNNYMLKNILRCGWRRQDNVIGIDSHMAAVSMCTVNIVLG